MKFLEMPAAAFAHARKAIRIGEEGTPMGLEILDFVIRSNECNGVFR